MWPATSWRSPAEKTGTVISLHADNTQAVKRGQLLVELDPSAVAIVSRRRRPIWRRTVRAVRAQFAKADALTAEIRQARSRRPQAEADHERPRLLAKDGAVSGEELAHARDTVAPRKPPWPRRAGS